MIAGTGVTCPSPFQTLGDTLDKIAWHKGGIFKRGSQAYAVEQHRGGLSTLREVSLFRVQHSVSPGPDSVVLIWRSVL